jgi:transcriptional regulator with XRE-family HTH domain
MNNRELKDIIKEIQKGEGINLTEIAKESKVGRSHLSTLINDEEEKEVEAPLIGKLSKKYPTYFNEQNRTNPNELAFIMASLKEIRGIAISILTGQSAGQEVIMGALDRLEEKPEGSLSAAADKLALQLAQRMKVIQRGNHEEAHKKGK